MIKSLSTPNFYKFTFVLFLCCLQGCVSKQILKDEKSISNTPNTPKPQTENAFSGFANSEWFGEYKGTNPTAVIQLKMDAVCLLSQNNSTLKMGSYTINKDIILIAQGEQGWKGTLKDDKLIMKSFMGEQNYVLTKQREPFDPTA